MSTKFFACVLVLFSVSNLCFAQIYNGDMSQGDKTPAGWELTEDEGALSLNRDTAEFVSAPASLRLESVNGKAKGNAHQELKLPAGKKIAVTGKVRAEGRIDYAAVALLAIGSKQSWQQLCSFAGANSWDKFTGRAVIPDDAQRVLLLVFMDGDGQVWLDDLKIIEPSEIEVSPVVEEFNRDPDFSYGDFAKKFISTENGILSIKSKAGRGGAARNLQADFAEFADCTPVMRVRTGSENRAKKIRLFFQDQNKKRRVFTYNLEKIGGEFTDLAPDNAPALQPGPQEDTFDASQIIMVQVQGAWNGNPVNIEIDKIELVKPNAAMLAEREQAGQRAAAKKAQQEKEAAAKAAKIRQMLAEGVEHPADGANVNYVCAVDRNILAINIRDREVKHLGQEPYTQQEGDEIRAEGKSLIPVWKQGKIVREKKNHTLYRQQEGRAQKFASYREPFGTWQPTIWRESISGTPLITETIDSPEAYRISSESDPAFQAGITPTAVYRKSKPVDQDMISGQKAMQHIIYLKLPDPLREGADYKLELKALNTREASIDYKHKPREIRSESIHVNQIGYRPDDPYKRAYLSLWLGTGGSHEFNADGFELIDATSGKTVYQGKVSGVFPASQPEKLKVDKNFNFTDVYYLDFSDFSKIGSYRIHIPGIGCSYPFDIGDKGWSEAFRTSMHGLLSHRSGIELGPPFSKYRRPRNMHPADGFKIFEMSHTKLEGEAHTVLKDIDRQLGEPLAANALKPYAEAWGGYMDAGDWDRRSQHMDVSYALLELYETNPAYFAKFALSLPPTEAEDRIPDLVNEALWNIDLYRRLQRPDGGVGGGIESVEHPRSGEASWQETLLLGTFAPDPTSSYIYAACAAKSAGLLADIDLPKADLYRKTAVKAWDWAEKNSEQVLAEISQRSPAIKLAEIQRRNADERMRAAAELFALTGEDIYHQAFAGELAELDESNISEAEIGAMFTYARLPEEKTRPSEHEKSLKQILFAADQAVEFGRGNAFGLHTRAPGVPMMGYLGYYSVPEMITGPSLPRAYILTGDEKYLRAALAAANFSAGANPVNITFTTGVGQDYPRAPLHIDSRVTGQTPPAGITVYGPMDAAADWGFNGWVHNWHLGEMVPDSRAWPASEWYVDLFLWPAMNEYTVHQTFRPTAYYWGFLASRGKVGATENPN